MQRLSFFRGTRIPFKAPMRICERRPHIHLFPAYNYRGLFISNQFEWGGGLIETGDLFERGGLFNLEKTMVSILHKKLEYKVEMLKYKRLEVMQPRIKNNSELLVGTINHPGSVHGTFYSCD